MKPTRVFLFVTLLSALLGQNVFSSGESEDIEVKTLSVYCYDSFSSEWGAGPRIAEEFFNETGIKIIFNAPGDGITVLNQLILEKESPKGDVVIGLDSSLLKRSLDADILEEYRSPNLKTVPSEMMFDQSHHLLPYDYGHFAICYDSETLAEPPKSLEDLCSEKYADSLILMDPRTSTPGLGFLLWTVAVYEDAWPEYWLRLKPSILTITDGWSQGYTLFTAGEAPMVLSYGTSPVYHAEYEDSKRYKAAEFTDGHLLQVEGMGIVKNTEKRLEAEMFIDFMLNEKSQEALALSNIMFPANSELTLPESFKIALRPQKTLNISLIAGGAADSSEIEELIKLWTGVFSR